jgi:hypothetical protein
MTDFRDDENSRPDQVASEWTTLLAQVQLEPRRADSVV